MATSGQVDVLTRGYEAFSAQDMTTLASVIAESSVWHIRDTGALDGDYSGRDAAFGFFAGLAEETAGTFHLQVVDLLAGEGSHVAALLVGTGTRRGRSLEARLVHVADIRNGLIHEFWSASLEPSKAADFWA